MAGWAAAMRAAAFATLGTPSWWAMALAAFLVRGGVVVLLLPVVTLPTVAGLTGDLAPLVVELGLSDLTAASFLKVLAVVLVAGGWLLAAGLIGAWLDVALLRAAAADEELELARPPAAVAAGAAFTARLLAHLPTLLALGYASARLGQATYDELLSPGDAAIPLAARVMLRAVDAPLALVAGWAAGEALGGIAVRRLAAGDSLWRALLGALRDLARPGSLATLALTNAKVAGVVAVFWLAANLSWQQLRTRLLDGTVDLGLGAALLVFIGTWLVALTALGVALAWRATAWTAEVDRQAVTRPPRSASEPSRWAAEGP